MVKKKKRYKRHFLCFKCRKNFKQPNEKDLAEKEGELSLLLNAFYFSKPKKNISQNLINYLNEKYFNRSIYCPECRSEMIEVPMSFETPAKKHTKKWEILESHYKAEGFIYNGLPNKTKDYILLLEDSYKWHLKMLQNVHDHKAIGENTINTSKRLRENIKSLESELEKIKLS